MNGAEFPIRCKAFLDAPNGAEQLRALMGHGAFAGIGTTMQFRLVEVEDGRVVFEGTPGTFAYNSIGTVHGGYAATLLDSACGCAVHSRRRAAQGYTALELKVAYHKATTESTGIVSRGRLGRKRWAAARHFAEARIIDGAGKLYASATSTLLVFDR